MPPPVMDTGATRGYLRSAGRPVRNWQMTEILRRPPLSADGLPHSSHWGAYSVRAGNHGIEIVPHPRDSDPSALLGNIPAAVAHKARVARPMIRRGWLEEGPGPDRRRGCDEFVAV